MRWHELDTQGRVDAIRSVWQPGMSAQAICDRIDGCPSRNAIIGMLNRHAAKMPGIRLGASGDNGQVKTIKTVAVATEKRHRTIRGGSVSKARLEVVQPEPTQVLLRAPHTAPVPLLMLTERRCKWCVNEPERGTDGHLFCAAVKSPAKPYCDFHTEASKGAGTESERSAVRALSRAA